MKSLCNTRSASLIKSVTTIRHQTSQLRTTLLALSEDPAFEPKDRSDAKDLFDVLDNFEFICGTTSYLASIQ
jgi:hypothetical protein